MKILLALSAVTIALTQPALAGGVPVIDATQIANAKQHFAQEIAQMAKVRAAVRKSATVAAG